MSVFNQVFDQIENSYVLDLGRMDNGELIYYQLINN